MTIINSYQNGNCLVKLFDDGTKERLWSENEIPQPEFPESIDLKITDYCDAGCKYCHEQSTIKGLHADLSKVISKLSNLPAGVELAIGGGNPLAHPDLFEFLEQIKKMGLIANVTVNSIHIKKYFNKIHYLKDLKLAHGLGVSFNLTKVAEINRIWGWSPNLVIHFIAGVHNIFDAMRLQMTGRHPGKFLVLGYKNFGFGKQYFSEYVTKCLDRWRYFLPLLMRKEGTFISFDNLAIEQLGVSQWVSKDTWNSRYMGNDGQFTMYMDGVKNQFAISSTGDRLSLDKMNVADAFKNLQNVINTP